jgi:hypothetical protein
MEPGDCVCLLGKVSAQGIARLASFTATCLFTVSYTVRHVNLET